MAIAMGWQKPDNVAGSSAPAIMVGLFVATGGLLFGYDTGAINGIMAMDSFNHQFSTGFRIGENGPLGLSPQQTSLLVAMLSLGTSFGALLSAPLADGIGRRLSLITSVGVFCFGGILQVVADALPMMFAGRFFAGVGVGGVSLLVPLYQSEMAPKWIRGTLVCAYQLAITVGLLTASIVNIITQKMPGAAAYRIPIGLQLSWACVLALGLIVLPETPRYLIKRGHKDAAALSLSRLRRLDITHPAIIEELAEIHANHEYEMTLGPSTYKDIFMGSPHLGRRTLTGCGLQMLQQLTGINFIMYYGTTFFNRAGVSSSFLISLIFNIINTVSTIPGLFVVESWGRRNLLMIGAVGMAVAHLVIAIFSTVVVEPAMLSDTSSKILIAFVALFIFSYAASWGPVAWVVTSELFPLKIRAKAMSVTTASNWILNFGIAYSTPYMVSDTPGPGYTNLGARVFWVWGFFSIMAGIFVYFMVYETSKMSLEQIDEMYERVNRAVDSKSFTPSWSFVQLQNEGFADSGIHTGSVDHLELQPTRTTSSSAGESISTTISSDESAEAKMVKQLGHVEFSY